MPRDTLVVDLRGLGPALTAHCERLGLSRSEFIRQAVATAINVPSAGPTPAVELERSDARETKRISLRLRRSTHAQLTAAASRCGTTLTRYIEAAATGRPLPVNLLQIAPDAVAALVRSTYELRAVGRNINQIAHALHIYPGALSAADVHTLRSVSDHVKAHIERASVALRDMTSTRRAAHETE